MKRQYFTQGSIAFIHCGTDSLELLILQITGIINTIICLLVPGSITVIPQMKTSASNITGQGWSEKGLMQFKICKGKKLQMKIITMSKNKIIIKLSHF